MPTFGGRFLKRGGEPWRLFEGKKMTVVMFWVTQISHKDPKGMVDVNLVAYHQNKLVILCSALVPNVGDPQIWDQ